MNKCPFEKVLMSGPQLRPTRYQSHTSENDAYRYRRGKLGMLLDSSFLAVERSGCRASAGRKSSVHQRTGVKREA